MAGYDTDLTMRIHQPDRWRGQCAEYCGEQHAHMSFYMVAEPKEQFEAWLHVEAQSAVPPSNPPTVHGQQVFLTPPV